MQMISRMIGFPDMDLSRFIRGGIPLAGDVLEGHSMFNKIGKSGCICNGIIAISGIVVIRGDTYFDSLPIICILMDRFIV